MIKIAITFLVCVLALPAYTQTMIDVLKLLPGNYVAEVNVDSLVANKVYYPADNSSEEGVKYILEKVDEVNGALRIEMKYETGQNGFGRWELKRLKLSDKEYLIVYSHVTGVTATFAQGNLETFNLRKGKLTKTNSKLLEVDLGVSDFVKSDTPDSVISKYTGYASPCYELIYYGDNICYVLHENFGAYGVDKSWLLGNSIEFVFRKGRFKRLPPSFRE